MTNVDIQWVRSHVERLLEDEWEQYPLSKDSDGDYPFISGQAAGWVSVFENATTPMVRVWSHAAIGIKPTGAMWRELNDIQLKTTTCSIMWCQQMIVVSQTVSAHGLTRPALAQALDAVSGVASHFSPLASMFCGSTPLSLAPPEQAR